MAVCIKVSENCTEPFPFLYIFFFKFVYLNFDVILQPLLIHNKMNVKFYINYLKL